VEPADRVMPLSCAAPVLPVAIATAPCPGSRIDTGAPAAAPAATVNAAQQAARIPYDRIVR
jgi:hypothetical protein